MSHTTGTNADTTTGADVNPGVVFPRQFTLDVTAANGTPFRVLALMPGEVGTNAARRNDAFSLVEFYDRRYPFTKHGQFTGGSYHLHTLTFQRFGAGLNLAGDVDAWRIDGDTMALVVHWLNRLATLPGMD